MKNDKFYITTSIAYTNAPPHIGFALELIQADVLARYNRYQNNDVYFLTGTDEHGTKVEKAAKEAGLSPGKFVGQISSKFKELTKILNISNTDFIRTTDTKRHIPAVQKVWQTLRAKGDIYKKKYKGLYCSGCEAFLTKKDLVDGKCPHHKIKPQIVEEENYFFRLSKYQKQIKKIIKTDQIKIVPEERKNEILSFIEEGLEDISFSRSKEKLKWGIEVPDDSTQIIYVWCDALTNYISALGFAAISEKFKKFWPADIHLIGKDILRFHAVYWPAMLLSLNLPLPKTILVHGFITVEGQKMSKSLGNIVDPFKLVEKYGTDATRYFLLREIPTTKDGDFSYSKFEKRYSDDLARGLGNLVARAMGLKVKSQKSKVKTTTQNSKVNQIIKKIKEKYKGTIEGYKLNEALAVVWELISFCDKYIEEKRLWEETERKRKDIENILKTIQEIASLLKPFLPQTSEKILNQLKDQTKKEILFPKL
ncbi:MAG: methionine--tRNA ligase [Candidatus Pacebacteria bacterium]|nr:methionine--tRNA ligase [Candidatus Paceibacterota bacterium]